MAVKFCQGTVPAPDGADANRPLAEAARKSLAEMEAAFAELAMHKALIAIWEFINTVNRYIVVSEPWSLAKNPADKTRLMTVIYDLLESLRVIAVLISPFMPGTAGKILERVGVADPAAQTFATVRSWGGLAPGNPFNRGDALFPRVEYKGAEKAPEQKEKKMEPLKPEISYEDFEKVDLRVAKILSAEPVPKSSKLVKLRIDIGEERTIVAGIAKDYKPEDLAGKSIVVVANLKPTKLMGVDSYGMLLATDAVEGLTLIGFDKPAKTGAKVR
jgi:methionyl-tRNA synthetase